MQEEEDVSFTCLLIIQDQHGDAMLGITQLLYEAWSLERGGALALSQRDGRNNFAGRGDIAGKKRRDTITTLVLPNNDLISMYHIIISSMD